jgi:3-hydroxymyristoyl/3-hydroxydecanoyl-(acyl carrier protein) dehydratase
MRWRFADRIDAFEPWRRISGRKGISLEEYSLLERFGRRGVLPESLVLETCVHFARWLVAASSDWRQSCLLAGIEEFGYESEARMGDNMRVEIKTAGNPDGDDKTLRLVCNVSAQERRIASGTLALKLVDLDSIQDAEALKIMWRELKA